LGGDGEYVHDGSPESEEDSMGAIIDLKRDRKEASQERMAYDKRRIQLKEDICKSVMSAVVNTFSKFEPFGTS